MACASATQLAATVDGRVDSTRGFFSSGRPAPQLERLAVVVFADVSLWRLVFQIPLDSGDQLADSSLVR